MKIMRNPLLSILLLLVTSVPLINCNHAQQTLAQQVTFSQVVSDPSKYNNKNVVVEGFYFTGFEVMALCQNLEPSGYAPGHLIPKGELIWIEGGIPHEIAVKLQHQQMMGPSESYGKVRMTGRFQFGKMYGHLGGYKYQITPLTVELLDLSPQ